MVGIEEEGRIEQSEEKKIHEIRRIVWIQCCKDGKGKEDAILKKQRYRKFSASFLLRKDAKPCGEEKGNAHKK